jgi:zinc protease
MGPTLAAGLTPLRQSLDNGAVVLVQEVFGTPAVAINVTFLTGSIDEPEELGGLAYLMGRVIDRGTERRSAEAIAEALDDRGVSLQNASTRHTTPMSCTCLAEDFDELLSLTIDIARRPTFPEDELAKRRAESITALCQDADNPAVRAGEALSALLYGDDHPYGRPAKGTSASLERIDRASVAAFHARNIRPSILSIVIVGDVDAHRAIERATEELETEIDPWSGQPASPIVVPPPARPAVRRERRIGMPGKAQSDIAYGFTTISRLDPRFYAYWMMNNILGQFGLGGRLADNIRERQGMAYYAFSSFEPSFGEAPLVVRAGVDPQNVERALEAIDMEVRLLAEGGPTPAEVEETRAYLIGSIPRQLETNDSIAAFLQNCEQFGLGLDFDRRLPELIQSVTIEEIRSAAAEVLSPLRAAVAIAGPDGTNGTAV